MIHTTAWISLHDRERTVYDGIALAEFPGWFEAGALFFIVGTLVSLYFMYNVRRT